MEKDTMTVDPEGQQIEKLPENLSQQITVTNDEERTIRKLVSAYSTPLPPLHREN